MDDKRESTIAVWVAALLLIPAIYLAFWVIDWGTYGLWLQIAFCVIVPSVLGSIAGAITGR